MLVSLFSSISLRAAAFMACFLYVPFNAVFAAEACYSENPECYTTMGRGRPGEWVNLPLEDVTSLGIEQPGKRMPLTCFTTDIQFEENGILYFVGSMSPETAQCLNDINSTGMTWELVGDKSQNYLLVRSGSHSRAFIARFEETAGKKSKMKLSTDVSVTDTSVQVLVYSWGR